MIKYVFYIYLLFKLYTHKNKKDICAETNRNEKQKNVKLEAKLAHGMLSLPATKGFEIGSGFAGTVLRGSQHNDLFKAHPCGEPSLLQPQTNNAGGTLGGISSGADLFFRVAIKPVSSIGQEQQTVDFNGKPVVLAAKGRHDPCVLPRAPPLIEAMTSLVLADAALAQLGRVAATAPRETAPLSSKPLNGSEAFQTRTFLERGAFGWTPQEAEEKKRKKEENNATNNQLTKRAKH